MGGLENGQYEPVTAKTVVTWPFPDADGDGDEVWEQKTDSAGNSLGRERVKDRNGNPVRHYKAPEGFTNFRSFDGADNYVRTNDDGTPWRHPRTGEAVSIAPGQTLVMHPNGDTQTLVGEYEQYLFSQHHKKVSTDTSVPDTADELADGEEDSTKENQSPSVKKATAGKVRR